jgi:hypothetical protein
MLVKSSLSLNKYNINNECVAFYSELSYIERAAARSTTYILNSAPPPTKGNTIYQRHQK